MQDTKERRTWQRDLSEGEVERLSALFAPNPSQFSGDRNRHRPRPNLYVETVSFDEHGEEFIGTTAPRGVTGTSALAAHFVAGRTQTPSTIPNYNGFPIRAVSLGYEEDDLVGWFDLDLDGGYPIERIGPALVSTFGRDRLVCHSGSGKVGRHRVFGLLSVPLPVRRVNELLRAICARLGFPPIDGSLEIAPAYRHFRLPLGAGGCRMFDIATGKPMGEQNQAKTGRAMLSLVPIDLESVARDIGADLSGIDTGNRSPRGRFDPYTRRERERPIPRNIRNLLHRGVARPGERQTIQHAFVTNCLLSGKSLHDAVESFRAYIDEGKFDASEDVKRYGREWLKKQALRIVCGIYASTRPIGMPDPIPCDGAEIHRIRKIAIRVHAEHPEFSIPFVEKFLKKILAIFRGCLAAGLPLARIHSKIWQAAGGTRYACLRAACGIFDARSGYKSMKLVSSRAHLGARPCEAYAISWSTSFVFDRDLPAPSYEISRSIFVAHDERHADRSPVVVVAFPSTSVSLSPTTVPSRPSRAPRTCSRLYVHRLHDPLQNKGSDETRAVAILMPNAPPTQHVPVDIDYPKIDAALSDEIGAPRRRAAEHKHAKRVKSRSPFVSAKLAEWQRIARWTLPAADMGLDEWLITDDAIRKEYAKERREAVADRDALERQHGIRVSIGRMASARFHELRSMFGLDSWE